MAYVLNALIAEPKVLESWPDAGVVALPQGRVLLPLPNEIWKANRHSSQPILRESDARAASESDFEPPDSREASLAAAGAAFEWIAARCAELSLAGPVAYVEAEYFGGAGQQAAALWDRGLLVLGPRLGEHPIDQVLARLGISRGAAHDEFDALDLGRFRMTDYWLKAAQPIR